MSTTIDLLRHGEPVGGRAYRGNQIDDPLSSLGWHQMHSFLPADIPWQRIVTSPMARCRDFAEELARDSDIPLDVETDLREVGFGSWEGRTPDEIKSTDPEQYDAFYKDPVNNRPDGAEPLGEFYQRTTNAFANLLERYSGQQILVITHAGVIRAIATSIMDAPVASMYRLKIDYAGLCRVRATAGRVQLEKFNSFDKQD